MGACTFTITGQGVLGRYRVVKGDLTFSDSYATGGDTLALTSVGLQEVRSLLVESNTQGASVVLDAANPSAPKFKLYTGDGTEATSTSDNDGITVPVWLLGAG